MSAAAFLDVYAACATCGATIDNWAARLLPIVRAQIVLTRRGELALQTSSAHICAVCDGAIAEIRIEDHSVLR